MTHLPAILCPIDFSEASRGSLRYAWSITQHFRSRLVVLAVDDPTLIEARDLSPESGWDPEATRHELAHFASSVLHGNPLETGEVDYVVTMGKPAPYIVHTAQEEGCGLIVMSTHGWTGMWKLFFGSTTERVLRETTVPVLVTPSADEGPTTLEKVRQAVGCILVPIDLTDASSRQLRIARGVAETLTLPLITVHVVEPLRTPLASTLDLPTIRTARRARADEAMRKVLAALPEHLHAEMVVAEGDPAEQIAAMAKSRNAGLIVMGLNGSPDGGPAMGSVTYRVLCLAPVLVLAVPPPRVGSFRHDPVGGGQTPELATRRRT